MTLLGEEVGHYVFLCLGTAIGQMAEPEIWTDPPSVDRTALHHKTIETALRLFGG